MITCSGCGKQIEKIPTWLQGIKAEFICNNCPNRTQKNIAFVTLPVEAKPAVSAEEEELELEDMPEED